MQRLMRAAVGTNNIDNCSRVCHSPTSFALRRSLGYSGATGSFDDIEARGRRDHHRRQPDRGPPRRRRADQAGGAARPAARDDRPAADRAGRPRRGAPRAAARARTPPSSSGSPTSSTATGLPTATSSPPGPRGSTPSRSCSRSTTRRPWRRSAACPRPTSSAPPRVYAEAREASVIWGLGVTEHKLRLGGRPADLRPGAHDGQGRAPRVGAAPAARAEQRPGLLRHGRAARHVLRLPAGGRRGGRAGLRGRAGARRCRAGRG